MPTATPAPVPASLTLAIDGMTCASCVSRVERALQAVPGVSQTAVNLTTGLANVTLAPDGQPGVAPAAGGELAARLAEAVEKAGYHATPIDAQTSAAQAVADVVARAAEHLASVRRRLVVGALASVPVLLMDLFHSRLIHLHSSGGLLALAVAQLLLATVVLVYTGGPYFTGAWKAGRHPNMDTLVALGAGTAYAYSLGMFILLLVSAGMSEPHNELHAAVTIITLVTLGKYLEARAKRSANAAVAGLAHQSGQTATLVLEDGSTRSVPAEQVAVGERVQVLAHQRVPVDGELLEGAGSLDASIVTGESTSIELSKGAGSALVAGGTTLLDGRIVLRATSTAATSTVARILQLVQTAQASKTQIQALADKVAGVFTPIVLVLAVGTFAGWMLYTHDYSRALIASIATVVIACPCAMGLATPTAITVATGRAARLGILFTQARALETARTITTVLFDKTGTLTQGQLQVIDVIPTLPVAQSPELTGSQVLRLAGSLEQFSTHPLAQAIVARAQADGLALGEPEEFHSVPGGGLRGVLEGREYALGSPAFMASLGIDVAAAGGTMTRMQGTGQTIVALARLSSPGAGLLGLIGLRDTLRGDAAGTLAALRAGGVRVGVVSGDTEAAVRGALGDLAVDFVLANVRPEEKAAIVARYKAEQPDARVAFVGDGVNDAPALAAADLGITLASGTDVAKAAGDVILLSGKLAAIPQTLTLARATIRVIKQNLGWAFGYNVAAIPLAMLDILSPGVAAGAMVLSSVSVVTNALRLHRVRIDWSHWQLDTGNSGMPIFTVGFNPAVDRILECPDFHIGGHQMATQLTRLAAGKSANVSRALALIGTDSIATGFVGSDELEFFHSQLMALGPGRILCRFVEVAGATRENISIIDSKRRVETHLRDRGFDVTAGEFRILREKLTHEVRPGDVVIFSGSLCGGVSAEDFVGLIERCNAAGARVVVDSSGETLKAACQKKLWVVKPNLEELRQLLREEIPNATSAVRDAARRLLGSIEYVLVSRGAAGAVLVTKGGAWSGRLTSREMAIRTVGCGDHLLAGFVAELMGGKDVEPALRSAMAVATARACSPDFGEFSTEAVKAAAAGVEIEAI